MSRGKDILGGEGRAKYGATIFLRCLVTGREEVRPVESPLMLGLRDLAAELDGRTDGVWIVQTYSTPQTIYDDLVRGHDRNTQTRGAGFIENMVLGKIGRLDLCAPELLAKFERASDMRTTRALRKQEARMVAYAKAAREAA